MSRRDRRDVLAEGKEMAEWHVVLNERVLERFRMEEGDKVTIGRGEMVDVRLDNGAVSRQHAALEMRGGKYFLTDLESTNGTSVNGTRIKGCVPVTSSDRIEIAKFRLVPAAAPDKRIASAGPGDFEGTVFLGPKEESAVDRAEPSLCLTVIQGEADPSRFPVGKQKRVTLGKDRACDIRVSGWLVAKRQCEIRVRAHKYFLAHYARWTRTTLNGHKICGEQELRRGDTIGIGGVQLRFS
jgi:hypothetical protein